MTEEIIIDCAFYKDGVCASPINKTCEYCKNIDVSKCYHKQLKQAENTVNECHKYQAELEDKIDRLEQENKELKKKIELDEVQLNSYFIGEEKICKENEKYRSALEEINRILLGVRGLSIHCDKQIIKVRAIVNEVLNDK